MAVVDTSLGFKFEGILGNWDGVPWVTKYTFKDDETLYKGDMANAESGEIDLGATGDTALLGIVQKTTAGTDSTTEVEVICDPLAVYSVYDPNARSVGDLLDLSGAAGAQTVAASNNNEFQVVANSGADERTFVRIMAASHAFGGA